MKYYIIAGEPSGDLHGSNLIKHLHQLDANADIRCWGGDMMEHEGATLVKHYRHLAFMGFVEVVLNLRTILKNIKFCKADIAAYKPDVVIFIDYPGFNIRMAKWAKEQGYTTIYYISPQVWAWKENRVKTIKAYVDKMLVILPFEKDFYSKWDYKVEYVGHPLVEVIEEYRSKALGYRRETGDARQEAGGQSASAAGDASSLSMTGSDTVIPTKEGSPLASEEAANLKHQTSNAKRIIALLPGSRKQEIQVKLPVMLEVSKAFPDYQFVVAKAPGMDDSFYTPFLKPYTNVSVVGGKTYDLLNTATAALVTSGTATLEAALFGVPEVVCYKGSKISYEIAKRVIKIKYISLVNLIMDKLVVKELIQDEMTTENCITELKDLLENPARQQQLDADYLELKNLLSQGGHASSNAAKIIVDFVKQR
jgi:lipid-A-disaccharide synthase